MLPESGRSAPVPASRPASPLCGCAKPRHCFLEGEMEAPSPPTQPRSSRTGSGPQRVSLQSRSLRCGLCLHPLSSVCCPGGGVLASPMCLAGPC